MPPAAGELQWGCRTASRQGQGTPPACSLGSLAAEVEVTVFILLSLC